VGGELTRPPFAALQVASRRALQSQLASDPLARGITITLIATSVVALVLAAIGLWVTLASDARDERGELFDLEAQGVRPETLRQELRLRSFLLLAVGVVAGAALGLLLSRLVVAIVGVSAETSVPDPPLAYQSGWPVALAGLAALALVTVALTEITVRRALGGRSPSRASWSLA
jgi:ABC-type antimicrobial peptide transport system permease subunit